MTVVERESTPAPVATKSDRTAMRTADVVFGVAVAVTFVCYFIKSSGVVVNGDDWETLLHGVSFGDYFRPYQTNLSIVPVAVYSFVFNVFGFGTYWPLRFADVASHMAIAVTVFLIVRSRWGSAVALVLGVAILWYPDALLTPSLFNHWLALIGCLVAGWALTLEPGRSDWIVVSALTFALASSAVGVAGAVGCVVYVALTRAPLRRWLAVGIPVGLFIVWWFTLSSNDHGQNAHLSVSERIRYVYDGVTYSFQLLAPGGRWLGIPLAILFVAAIVWQLRGGVRAAASGIAWTSAILAWWVGLAFTRAGAKTGTPDVFRYRVVTCGFAVLALLPMAKSARVRGLLTNRRALGVALVACAALVAINLPGIFHHVDIDAADYRLQSAKMVVLNMGPTVVADDTVVYFDLFTSMTARRYRKLVDEYGHVAGTNPEHPDAKLVQLTGIKPKNVERMSGDDVPQDCVAIGESTPVPRRRDYRVGSNQFTRVVLQAPSTDVMVQIQAFERDSWVPVGRLAAGTTATLELPILISSKTGWTLRADGACGVGLK